MKGIILYSSKTGNTKKMAEVIFESLKDLTNISISDIKDIKSVEKLKEFDFILLGAWINRANLEIQAIKFLKKIDNINIGLFATLGAEVDSEHGKKVIENLKKLLENKNSIGQYICQGLVDPKMIEKLNGFMGLAMPKKLKNKMIETSKKSRRATEEELKMAGEYFREKIKNIEIN